MARWARALRSIPFFETAACGAGAARMPEVTDQKKKARMNWVAGATDAAFTKKFHRDWALVIDARPRVEGAFGAWVMVFSRPAHLPGLNVRSGACRG